MIHQVAQEGKKIGQPLNPVDHDEPRRVFQGKLRLFQTGKILRVFQIEIGSAFSEKRHHVTGSPFQTGYEGIADLGAAPADNGKGVRSSPPGKFQHKRDHWPGGGETECVHDKSEKGLLL